MRLWGDGSWLFSTTPTLNCSMTPPASPRQRHRGGTQQLFHSIDKDDKLDFLLLAEFAMQARQWQAAAQLFARVMVVPFRLHYSEPYLVEHASRVIFLTTQRHGDLNWATDLLLYSHRR